MKKINKFIQEELKSYDQGIVDMLNLFAKNSDGYQHYLYDKKAKDADSVDIHPLSDVFSPEDLNTIKRVIKPKPKMCYENAWKLADWFYLEDNYDIQYCEGYLNFKGFPIEQAFNKVNGMYVDCTVELALKRDVREDTYVVIGEFDVDTVREILLENGYYGNIYDSIELKKFKELSKKDIA